MSFRTSHHQNQVPLDDLSDEALHFLFHARRYGMSWIHPTLIESPGPCKELIDAGVLTVNPMPVRAVRWPWEVSR